MTLILQSKIEAMNTIARIILSITLVLWFLPTITINAQIWPGDINNNGIVNGVDWLYYGAAFSETGPSRTEVSSIWAPHNAPEAWSLFFPEAVNYSYADCNGDGMVSPLDGNTLRLNFGLQRSVVRSDTFSSGLPGQVPPLYFGDHPGDTLTTFAGQALTIPISLGDEEHSVSHFYGLRFKLEGADSAFQKQIQITSPIDAWIGATIASHDLYIDGLNNVDFGVVRFDQENINGSGEILSLGIVMEENLIFNQAPKRTFKIFLDSMLLVDNALNTYAIAGDTLTFEVFPDSTSLITSLSNQPTFAQARVFPNPANQKVHLQVERAAIEKVEIWSIEGLEVSSNQYVFNNQLSGQIDLDVAMLSSGFYWIRYWINRKVYTLPLINTTSISAHLIYR